MWWFVITIFQALGYSWSCIAVIFMARAQCILIVWDYHMSCQICVYGIECGARDLGVEDAQLQQNCMCDVEGQEARAPHFHPCHSFSSTLHLPKVSHHRAVLKWTCIRFGSHFSNSFGVHHEDEGYGCCRSIASILLMSNLIPQVVALGFFLSP